jgi:hypothetical protein
MRYKHPKSTKVYLDGKFHPRLKKCHLTVLDKTKIRKQKEAKAIQAMANELARLASEKLTELMPVINLMERILIIRRQQKKQQ